MSKLVPVILCGGSGTRLWPLSRKRTPKQFLKLMDDYTLLQRTAKRTLDVTDVSEEDIVTVTLDSLREETTRQLSEIGAGLTKHILCEPMPRNTAAAAAFALCYVKETFGDDAIAWLLPADHFIGNEDALRQAVEKAMPLAEEDFMVTFGIRPSRPEIGYGYIRKAHGLSDSEAFAVREFVEKPGRDMAIEFVRSGDYLWNSGMQLFKVSAALREFDTRAPATLRTVEEAMRESGDRTRPSAVIYSEAKEEALEKAVTEKVQKIAVIPCDPKWSDIGCWESLWEIKSKDEHGNALQGNVACHSTRNSMVLSQSRLVTCVGMTDVIVIETGDSVLVADKKSNHSLKMLVEALRESERPETVSSATDHHYWGSTTTLAETAGVTLREIVIKPGQIREKSYYDAVSGNWMVVSGKAEFIVGQKTEAVSVGKSLGISEGESFTIANKGNDDLRLYEILYLESDDESFELPPVSSDTDIGQEKRMAA